TLPARRAVRGARRSGRGGIRLARYRGGLVAAPGLCAVMPVPGKSWLLVVAMVGAAGAVGAAPAAEPNTQVPSGSRHYAAGDLPDRIVASPAQDASTGFSVAWRTAPLTTAVTLELAVAGDSPHMGELRRITASSRLLHTENGPSQHHRADIDGLRPDTL